MRNVMGAALALLLSFQSQAQDLNGSPATRMSDSVWSIYQKSRGENLAIFQGRQILGGYPGISGSAYFPFSEWSVGSVQYEGIWYHDLELLFDIYREELMVKHPSGVPFVLYTDRVQQFQIKDRKFVHFGKDQTRFSPGIYEVISEGKLMMYSRRIAIMEEKIVDQSIERNFLYKHKYFACLNGECKAISKQKQLLDLLKSDRSKLAQAVKDAKLKFKIQPDAVINLIADTYNQLNP